MIDERKMGIRKVLFQILSGTGDEIVDADHLAAFSDEMIRKMGANETGGARNKNFFWSLHDFLDSCG